MWDSESVVVEYIVVLTIIRRAVLDACHASSMYCILRTETDIPDYDLSGTGAGDYVRVGLT